MPEIHTGHGLINPGLQDAQDDEEPTCRLEYAVDLVIVDLQASSCVCYMFSGRCGREPDRNSDRIAHDSRIWDAGRRLYRRPKVREPLGSDPRALRRLGTVLRSHGTSLDLAELLVVGDCSARSDSHTA